jgi:hypothetical protein
MDEDSYRVKYGNNALEQAFSIAGTLDIEKVSFIFPFGTNADTKEFIEDTLAFFKTLQWAPIADTILELPHLGCGINTSIHKSTLDSNYQLNDNSPLVSDDYKGKVIPIVTTGFVKAAATLGSRSQVYHDYIQDVVQDTYLKPFLLDRQLLILSPVDTNDPEFYSAFARLGRGQFRYWQEGVNIDLKSLYEQMQNLKNERNF